MTKLAAVLEQVSKVLGMCRDDVCRRDHWKLHRSVVSGVGMLALVETAAAALRRFGWKLAVDWPAFGFSIPFAANREGQWRVGRSRETNLTIYLIPGAIYCLHDRYNHILHNWELTLSGYRHLQTRR